jgi:hypothetical protein
VIRAYVCQSDGGSLIAASGARQIEVRSQGVTTWDLVLPPPAVEETTKENASDDKKA